MSRGRMRQNVSHFRHPRVYWRRVERACADNRADIRRSSHSHVRVAGADAPIIGGTLLLKMSVKFRLKDCQKRAAALHEIHYEHASSELAAAAVPCNVLALVLIRKWPLRRGQKTTFEHDLFPYPQLFQDRFYSLFHPVLGRNARSFAAR